jgi:hypothetical protein
MLKAIFYARFHPERGPSIIHQHPKSAIVSTRSSDQNLFDFSSISSYIIPPYELCDQSLSICVNGCRVLGFPISLQDEKYERNRFTFNVCFVLEDTADPNAWARIVSKTAAFFRELEDTDGLLQLEEQLEGLRWAGEEAYPAEKVGVINGLLKLIFTELNIYGEACVRLSDLHVLNLQLANQQRLSQPTVKSWDVPLLVRSIADDTTWTWDLTLQRIHAHINGVNHVQAIGALADVELKLVKRATEELVQLDRVILLDIFHFQAVYALTGDFAWFIEDETMQRECWNYVAKPDRKDLTASGADHRLVGIYRHFGPGTSVSDLFTTRQADLAGIDVRRLVTFAIIKGFLRRIHKYTLSTANQVTSASRASANGSPDKAQPGIPTKAERDLAWKQAAFSSGWTTPPFGLAEPIDGPGTSARGNTEGNESEQVSEQDTVLLSFLDGRHCMDEICVSLHLSEKQVLERLRQRTAGEYVLFNK